MLAAARLLIAFALSKAAKNTVKDLYAFSHKKWARRLHLIDAVSATAGRPPTCHDHADHSRGLIVPSSLAMSTDLSSSLGDHSVLAGDSRRRLTAPPIARAVVAIRATTCRRALLSGGREPTCDAERVATRAVAVPCASRGRGVGQASAVHTTRAPSTPTHARRANDDHEHVAGSGRVDNRTKTAGDRPAREGETYPREGRAPRENGPRWEARLSIFCVVPGAGFEPARLVATTPSR